MSAEAPEPIATTKRSRLRRKVRSVALDVSPLRVGALAGRPPVLLVYAAIALIAFLSAIDSPTRSAMTPRLVGHELLPSALALNQVAWNSTALVGPAIAGVVIER